MSCCACVGSCAHSGDHSYCQAHSNWSGKSNCTTHHDACECRQYRLKELETENAKLREALRRVLNSKVVIEAPFASYSEAISDALEVLAATGEKKEEKT